MVWPFPTEQSRLQRNQKKTCDASEREQTKLQQLKQTRPPDDPAVQAQQQVCTNAREKCIAAQTAYKEWCLQRDQKEASDAVDREKAKLDNMKQTLPPTDPAILNQQDVWKNAVAKLSAANNALKILRNEKMLDAGRLKK